MGLHSHQSIVRSLLPSGGAGRRQVRARLSRRMAQEGRREPTGRVVRYEGRLRATPHHSG